MPRMMFGIGLAAALSMVGSTWGQEAGVESGNDISFQTCGGLVGGAELAFLRPYADDIRGLSVRYLAETASVENPSNDFEAAWRLWLGYVNPSGSGLRARYWQFDHDLAAETWSGNVGGDPLSAAGSLRMYTIDVELTQQIAFRVWNVNAGAGLRVAGVDHDFSLAGVDGAGDPAQLLLDNKFEGVGPTVFLESRRPIGSGGLAVLVNTRGSLVFGKRDVSFTIPDMEGVPDIVLDLSAEADSLLAIGEIQIGFEWARELQGGTRVFSNVLWEGQTWGNTLGSTGVTGVILGAGLTR